MKRTFRAALAAPIGAALIATAAAAADPIGQVKTLAGAATLTRDGKARSIAAGDDLFSRDSIATASDGALGLTLVDNTTVALGPASRVVLDEVVFDPAAARLNLAARFFKGRFAVVAGKIAALAPERCQFAVPGAILRMHGTSFLVKVDD